jgi:hypothetical protein
MKLFALALIVFTALGLVYCQSDYQDLLRKCKAQGYAEDTCISLLR